MQYEFHQAVMLEGKLFKLGVNEVSSEIENHADFLKFVGAGFISDVGCEAPRVQSPKERAETLLHKLRNRAVAKVKQKKEK